MLLQPPLLVFKWLIDTLYKVISMQFCILSFSLPKQIKMMINCYVYIIRETLAGAVVCFAASPISRVTWSPLYKPFFFFYHVQLLWYFKQSQDGDNVQVEPPACVCVTTSQLLLRDITTDNLLWIFITLTHTLTCAHTPLIKKSSLSCCWAA